MNFFVIGDRETVLGFRLVGVDGLVAGDRDGALAALNDVVLREEVGIVLLTERVAAQIRDEVDSRLYGFGFPLILEIPDATGPAPNRLQIEDVVRKAIGVSI